MSDEIKANDELLTELSELRERVAELQAGNDNSGSSNGHLERLAMRDAMVADLSCQALKGWYIYSLLDAAVRLTAEALEVDICSVFKMENTKDALRLVAGVGWSRDVVGSATVGTAADSQAGYTVLTARPVVVKDFQGEERFLVSEALAAQGVASGLSVPMMAGNYVFGVMSVHSKEPREFTQSDVHFMETVANILTIAALRRQAVVALRQSNHGLEETKRLLSNLVEASSDAIISTNSDGKVVLCNKGAERLLGYQRQEVIGEPVSMLYESEAEAERVIQVLRSSEGVVAGLESVLVAKDGGKIPVSVSASVFYDEEGRETGTVRFSRDLRDRIRWQEELEHVNEEIVKTQNALEQAQVEADAAKELRRANEELHRHIEYNKKAQEQLLISEKMIALGRLTAGVSHEILNPLNVITIRLHMMLTDPDVPPEVTEKLKMLDEQVTRIAKITSGLLDYARKRKPIRRQMDFNDTIRRTVNLVDHDFRQRNVTVVLGFDTRLPSMWADHDQLQQVVLNLLTNARDAMPKGGQLVVSTSSVQDNGQGFAELKVEDSGPGILQENMDKVFDPFFTTKPEGKGTGLGLSICQGIVEAHGGTIRAENMEEGGAAFIVRLPLENFAEPNASGEEAQK